MPLSTIKRETQVQWALGNNTRVAIIVEKAETRVDIFSMQIALNVYDAQRPICHLN